MKNLKLIATLLFALNINSVMAADYFLIANENTGIKTLTAKKAKSIFLGRITLTDNGTVLKPCYGEPQKKSIKDFFNKIIKKDYARFVRYWNKKLFSGGGSLPRMIENNELLINYAKREKGAICLVDKLPKILPRQLIRIDIQQ